MKNDPDKLESKTLHQILISLQEFTPDARDRILRTAATFFEIGHPSRATSISMGSRESTFPSNQKESGKFVVDFSADMAPSPKEFLLEKQPRTDVERIACLAYYLTHYRVTPHFKTLDLSKLNTEAAQPKFSNATVAAKNAVKQGYLALATKGARQLSAAGEQFVSALPDREAAKSAMIRARPRRIRKSRKKRTRDKGTKPGQGNH